MCAARKEECVERSENTHREQVQWSEDFVHEAGYVQKANSNDEGERSHGDSIQCAPRASIYRVGTRILFQVHKVRLPRDGRRTRGFPANTAQV